jgi:hypothetical protein
MKSAADEFMAIHGRSPEAVILLPEVLQSASWGMSPMERQGLLAGQRPSLMLGRPSPNQLNPTAPKEMPSLSLFFRPKQKDGAPQLGAVVPVDAQHDPVYLKEAQFRMRGAAGATLAKPTPSQAQQKSFDASKSPDSFHMDAQSSQGSEVLRNLVQTMRTHGKEDMSRSYSMSIRDLPAPKAIAQKITVQKTKAKKRMLKTKSAKKKAKPAKKPAKTLARKALSRTAVTRTLAKKPTKRPLAVKARLRSKRPVNKSRKSRR